MLPGETLFVKENPREFLLNINEHFEKVGEAGELKFRLKDAFWSDDSTHPADLIFSPYYLINNQRYGIYWIFADEKETSQNQKSDIQQTKSSSQKIFLEGIGIGYGAQTEGNATTWPFMQEKGTGSVADPNELTRYAKKGGSFSYMFNVKPGKKNYLVCTFLKQDNGKTLCIKSGLKKIAAITLNYSGSEEKYPVEFELPRSLTKNQEIRICFNGIKSAESARLASPVHTEYEE